MSEINKTYRLRTNVGKDNVVKLNINQDFNVLEILSLKIGKENFYKLHTAKYGCVVGRVLANGSVGIPNAKVSIFIAKDDNDEDTITNYLYPYTSTYTKNDGGVRYNLLTEAQLNDCHRNVGTFPTKRKVLDDDNVLEVFDTYYKFTTTSNRSGDFMIFGVPTGMQTLHVDIDLSDIGMFSQKPIDFLYKGYPIESFDSPSRFKTDTNLDNLSQIFSQNISVYVHPFWGEENVGDEIKITRNDIEIDYKFEPTCVFMGSLITDDKSNGVNEKCIATNDMGRMNKLTAGEGIIEMIRKTPDGDVEEFSIKGGRLIDGDGTWCYQIPMNLDYMITDEYGNLVPTNDATRGIPTRTRVRFRVSMDDYASDNEYNHFAKMLIPHNPATKEDVDYVFGTNTKDNEEGTGSFRDLLWNNVYTVKSYIPRFQKSNRNRDQRFTGIKATNINDGKNPIPYNNMRVRFEFMFVLMCAILKSLIRIAYMWNRLMSVLADIHIGRLYLFPKVKCLSIGDGMCPELEGWYFAPGCDSGGNAMRNAFNAIIESENATIDTQSTESQNGGDESICLTNKIDYFIQCIEINLATENNVIQFDFYNDWLNGAIYMPRWFANFRAARSFLFGLIRINERVNGCFETNYRNTRKFIQQCALTYKSEDKQHYNQVATLKGCDPKDKKSVCHKEDGRKYVKIFQKGGIVHKERNIEGRFLYYFRPTEWQVDTNKRLNLFATDIVLLGSLNENDTYGIPQTFRSLPSTTYQMPEKLASTNMDEDGYMYGFDDKNSMCTNTYSTDALKRTNVIEISGNTSDTLFDDNEWPVTLASGIDWGYHGPLQKDNDKEHLYYPGGHFLGIDCKSSETNIKSCVNLSRVCELGATVSHRQGRMIQNESGYTVVYTIPNGLISKEEINNMGFRSEFATLNHNGLKTVYDNESGRRRYDMRYFMPSNFGGDLENWRSKLNEKYKYQVTQTVEIEDEGEDRLVPAINYSRVLEEKDNDYYLFRHGNTGKSVFAIEEGINVALPIYNNSYYFYFGIKDGSTAIDKFFNNYWSECPKKEYMADVSVKVEHDSDYCFDNGVVNVTIMNMTGPYFKVYVTDSDDKKYFLEPVNKNDFKLTGMTDSSTSEEELLYINQLNFNITDLKGYEKNDDFTYTINIIDSEGKTVERSFSVGLGLPEELTESKVSGKIFEKEIYSKINNNTLNLDEEYGGERYTIKCGKLFIKNVVLNDNVENVIICNDEYYYKYENNDIPTSLSGFTKNLTQLKYYSDEHEIRLTDFPVWEGNVNYRVYVIYKCSYPSVKYKLIPIGEYYVEMPVESDYYIGDRTLTGTYLRNHGIECSGTKWWKKLIEFEDRTEWNLSGSRRSKLLKALYFDKTQFGSEPCSIDFGLLSNDSNLTCEISGVTVEETIISGVTCFSAVWKTGDTRMLENIWIPTVIEKVYFDEQYVKTEMINEFEDNMPKDAFPIVSIRDYPISGDTTTVIKGYGSEEKDIYRGVIGSKEEEPFKACIKKDGEKISTIFLPSIYKPFYFEAIVYIGGRNNDMILNIRIHNGCDDNETKNEYHYKEICIKINNKTYYVHNYNNGYIVNKTPMDINESEIVTVVGGGEKIIASFINLETLTDILVDNNVNFTISVTENHIDNPRTIRETLMYRATFNKRDMSHINGSRFYTGIETDIEYLIITYSGVTSSTGYAIEDIFKLYDGIVVEKKGVTSGVTMWQQEADEQLDYFQKDNIIQYYPSDITLENHLLEIIDKYTQLDGSVFSGEGDLTKLMVLNTAKNKEYITSSDYIKMITMGKSFLPQTRPHTNYFGIWRQWY